MLNAAFFDGKLGLQYFAIAFASTLFAQVMGQSAEVILFRAGLIINIKVLSLGTKILNIHCARLPDYGGIGTIARALKDKKYDQAATLHVVTKSIDEGEIVKTLPYRLNPSESYCKNEMAAYKAGVQLLQNYLKS